MSSIITGAMFKALTMLLDKYLASRAERQQTIEALKRAIDGGEQTNITVFKEFFGIAVQNAEMTEDYTVKLDQLIQFLDANGDLQSLFERAVAPLEHQEQRLNEIAERVSEYCKQIEFVIPEALGSTPSDFTNKLADLVRTFLEQAESTATLNSDIQHLRALLNKPRLPLSATAIEDNQNAHNSFFKFKYDRRFVEYQPPESVKAALEDFLLADSTQDSQLPDIKILTLYGKAGCGKSRIAFELCLETSLESSLETSLEKRPNNLRQNVPPLTWHSGFLAAEQSVASFDHRWDRSCLIVFDYAAERIKQLKTLVVNLKAQHSQSPLYNPIRIVLLERQCSAETGWFKQLLDDANLAPFLYQTKQLPSSSMAISELSPDQLMTITKAFLQRREAIDPERLATLALEKAKQIEKGIPRPLIVQLIVELCIEDETLTYASIETLLAALFERENRTVANLAQQQQQDNVESFWQVLALATMAGGFSQTSLAQTCRDPVFADWFRQTIGQPVYELAQAYLGVANKDRFWPALEPDLLGEYLILRQWRQWQDEDGFALDSGWQQKLQQQLALALTLNEMSSAETLARLCLDFPNQNPLLQQDYYLTLYQQCPDGMLPVRQKYALYLDQFCGAKIIASHMDSQTEAVVRIWQQLLDCYSANPDPSLALALARYQMAFSDGKLTASIDILQTTMNSVLDIANKENRLEIWLAAAKGLFNIICALGPLDIVLAQDYVQQLLVVAEKQDQAEIWLCAAKGLVSSIAHLGPHDIALAQVYLQQLLAVADKQDQAEIWLYAAKGLFNSIAYIGPHDIALAQDYLQQLLAVAEKQDQAEIWLEAAKGLVNIIGDIGPHDIALAQDYLQQLLAVADKQDQAEIWLCAVMGLGSVIWGHIGSNNVELAKPHWMKINHIVANYELDMSSDLQQVISELGERFNQQV